MTKKLLMVPIDLEIFPARDMRKGTASELLEDWEHVQELITHQPSGKTGKKKLSYYVKQLKKWKIS